jgi:hypothetical protein
MKEELERALRTIVSRSADGKITAANAWESQCLTDLPKYAVEKQRRLKHLRSE